MHIRKIDLNLVAVFDAIMAEGSLSLAARRLGMSQSAVSHALSRLRRLTGDPLFVRTSHGVKPTPHASGISGPLRSAVDLVQVAFTQPVPGLSKRGVDRTFVLDLPVGFDLLLIPRLMAIASAFEVGARFRVHADRASDLMTALRYGETEIALDVEPVKARGIKCRALYQDQFAVLASKGHPALTDGLRAEDYCRLGHVTLKWNREPYGSPVDDRLAKLSVHRAVIASMPTLAGCAAVVSGTQLLFTIHRRVAGALAARFDLQVHDMPVAIDPVTVYKIWHERFENDGGHRWLRNALRQTARQLV